MFDEYLRRWKLVPDGEAIITASSQLLPVLSRDRQVQAMLKIAGAEEEQRGGRVMRWWQGRGMARVLAHDGPALLMERALDRVCLADLAHNGLDDTASRLICATVAKLHAVGPPFSRDLEPLARWFEPLAPAAETHGGVLHACARVAAELLAAPREVTALHGDVHHRNILDFGTGGWLAVDPKGLVGERGFDYANLFCNPDQTLALEPGRLTRQLDVVSRSACLERGRLLAWVAAWAGLSAAFSMQDGESPELALQVATLAVAEMEP